MGQACAIELRSDPTEIDRLARFIDGYCDGQGIGSELRFKLQLVAEELAMNAIMHGYADRTDGWIGVTLSEVGDLLALVVEDEASAFDPLSDRRPPPIDLPLEERPIGGLGLFLVGEMTKSVTYRRHGDRNVLTATFARSEAVDAPR